MLNSSCPLALMEFNDAEKLALRRWAGGGLLESTQTDNSPAWRFQAAS
jgi:hypothetical protein